MAAKAQFKALGVNGEIWALRPCTPRGAPGRARAWPPDTLPRRRALQAPRTKLLQWPFERTASATAGAAKRIKTHRNPQIPSRIGQGTERAPECHNRDLPRERLKTYGRAAIRPFKGTRRKELKEIQPRAICTGLGKPVQGPTVTN